MFYVYFPDENVLEPFESRDRAESYARECADEGTPCELLSLIRTFEERIDLSHIPHSFVRAMFGGSLPASMGRDYV